MMNSENYVRAIRLLSKNEIKILDWRIVRKRRRIKTMCTNAEDNEE